MRYSPTDCEQSGHRRDCSVEPSLVETNFLCTKKWGKFYLTTQVSIQNKIHAHMLESQSGRRRAASKYCSGHHSGQLSLPQLACLRYARERAEQMASRMAILAWCASKVGCQSMNENSSQGEMIRKTYTVTQQCLALCRFRFVRRHPASHIMHHACLYWR
jgi:hypothetical protein